MNSIPLLYRAAETGIFGCRYEFDSGSITDALFVYLDGIPSKDSISSVDADYRLRPIVCLTEEWEEFIRGRYNGARVYMRNVMKPSYCFDTDGEIRLPDGYTVSLFDESAFEKHPFGHGENYASFEEFARNGSGAAVWYGDEIVSSASSFLTVGSEVELDVSTEESHRGKGLASACVAMMLRDCRKRGITVHWDAQNETSMHLALKFGFEHEFSYSVFVLGGKINV